MKPVVVQSDRVTYPPRLTGYYERLEHRRGGYFITREQIDAEQPRTMSHLLMRVPGLALVRGRAGVTSLRMRGRTCVPLVWLDGTPMPAGEVDMDSFSPQSLEGIELYLGGTTPPLRYSWIRDRSACGTVLLWTRERLGQPPATSVDLTRIVDSVSVFTARQVDSPAVLEPGRPWLIDYPPALFASGITGSVLAEWIVDSAGRVERGTVGIVSATHPAFADAVVSSILSAAYLPARKAGRAVRQHVLQEITFAPEESATRSH